MTSNDDRHVRRSLGTALLVAALLGASPTGAVAARQPAVTLDVLSNRANIVSGGDVRVAVRLRRGVTAKGMRMTLGRRNVRRAFARRPNGRIEGLIEGMPTGRHRLTARLRNGAGARITITSHPHGGPVTSGPQIKPWACSSGATDAQCNRPVKYEFLYKPSGGGGLRAYDPANPPSDVATTTTDQGRKVPFIVRQETGTIDRDEYRIAVLFEPGKPWAPWAPTGFNNKLVIFHGFSCNTEYEQGDAPAVLNETALGRGFATMSHALNNAGHNCNIATQAESMIMTKERVIERYGDVRYTIGSGCSGGSLTQQQVANAYPGFYQGITPQCSFTDAWSSAMQYADYVGLRNYFERPTTRARCGVGAR